MGETAEAKRKRLDAKAEQMRAASAPGPDDIKTAYRIGYNAGIRITDMERRELVRKKPPFSTVEMRASWREGFDDSRNGLAVTIPLGAIPVQ